MFASDHPRVLHVVGQVLHRSETFIQRRLIPGPRYESTVLTWGLVEDGLTTSSPVRVIWPSEAVGWTTRAPRVARLVRHASVVQIMLAERPSVVHAHFGSVGAGVSNECRLLRLPLVTSFYGFDVGTLPREEAGARRIKRLLRHGAAFTAEGPALARALIALGAPADSVKLLPLCLPDWALGAPERAVSWTTEDLHLLQVARFAEKKGIDTTLIALARARARGVPATLTLVGDGGGRERLEKLAADLELGSAVRWLGFRPYEELPKLLAHAHLFVQPSRTAASGDTEGGHPTTLIEAQAYGVPVVGTTHADIPFVVKHGETGLLCPENDPDALAHAIVELHQSRDRLAAMGERARTLVIRRHHPERLRLLRERIYREARRSTSRGKHRAALGEPIKG